jgi:AhpD family alkylhydroperoxidase
VPAPLPGGQVAFGDELAVGLADRAAGQADVMGKGPAGRQPRAWLQPATPDRLAQPGLQRRSAPEPGVELDQQVKPWNRNGPRFLHQSGSYVWSIGRVAWPNEDWTREQPVKPRIDVKALTPTIYRRMVAFDDSTGQGLEQSLQDLVKTRASQLNGCAYCLDMHTKDARAAGESEQRLYALSAWRETPFFSERERAALSLTEAVTLMADGQVPDEAYELAARHFDEAELAALIWTIVVINAWNRVATSTRMVVGSYQP